MRFSSDQIQRIGKEMSNGWIHLNENPGLGLEISETALKKFGKLVYKNK